GETSPVTCVAGRFDFAGGAGRHRRGSGILPPTDMPCLICPKLCRLRLGVGPATTSGRALQGVAQGLVNRTTSRPSPSGETLAPTVARWSSAFRRERRRPCKSLCPAFLAMVLIWAGWKVPPGRRDLPARRRHGKQGDHFFVMASIAWAA